MRRWLVITAAVVGVVAALARGQEGVKNAGFEEAGESRVPAGWAVSTEGYTASLCREAPAEGKACLRLEKTGSGGGFGTVYQMVPADAFKGKRVVLTGSLRAHDGAGAQMWMRVDRADGSTSALDNMGERPVQAEAWTPAKIALDVAPDSAMIFVGLLMNGPKGSVDIDGLQLRATSEIGAGNEPPRPLSEEGLTNLRALARVYGVVRYFHASDQGKKADWDLIAVEGVRRIEGAAAPDELAKRLADVFGEVAPSAVFRAGADAPEGASPPAGAKAAVAMRYEGLGSETPGPQSVYEAHRERWTLPGAGPEGMPEPGAVFVEEVAPGVWARIPTVVYAGDAGTLPEPTVPPLKPEGRPEGWGPTTEDRATRLGAVMVAWNAMKHFSPYLDSPGVDWPAELPRALKSAAEDKDTAAFALTLGHLAAGLRDGHTYTRPSPGHGDAFPWSWMIVEGKAVVGKVVDGRSQPAHGEIVVSIDGRPMEEILKARGSVISAATDQWRRARLATELHAEAHEHAHVEFKRPDGSVYAAEVNPIPISETIKLKDTKPENGSELAPGVVYFDLNGASEAVAKAQMERFKSAKAIVFDMRGYPGVGFRYLLPQLSDKTLTSASWEIPVFTRPDQEGVTFGNAHWTIPPAEPRLTAPCVFITDGRAISYAESCMGIVEHYKLGRIVGGPTAGSNGNINYVHLPGGGSISFTGMRVRKQDGSRHHGVGIQPTDPIEPTLSGIARGRDELLEKATAIAGELAAHPE